MSINKWFSKEINRIIKFTDVKEQEKQSELLCAVIDKKNEYEFYVQNYKKQLLVKDLEQRGAKFERADITQEELMKKWGKVFANELTDYEKEKIYFSQFMWHIFSYEKIESLVGAKARQAFTRIRKNHIYVFYQNQENVFYVDNAKNLKSADFDMDQDVYVVDLKMAWTYVHTHEKQCGPYFMRVK